MIGRLGELAVEQELLKRGWMVGNFNASLPNTMAYDLFAVKGSRRICLRVKATSGTNIQYSAKKDGAVFRHLTRGDDGDFVAIVFISEGQPQEFYLIPTKVVSDKLITSSRKWNMHPKRDGTQRETGRQLSLEFSGKRSSMAHRGMRIKWARYLNAWSTLE